MTLQNLLPCSVISHKFKTKLASWPLVGMLAGSMVLGSAGIAQSAGAFWCNRDGDLSQVAYGYSNNSDCGIVSFFKPSGQASQDAEAVLQNATKDVCINEFHSLRGSMGADQLCSPTFFLPRRAINYLSSFVRAIKLPDALTTAARETNVDSDFSLIAAMPLFKIYEQNTGVAGCVAAESEDEPNTELSVCPVPYTGGLPQYIIALVSQTNQQWLGNQSRIHLIATPDDEDSAFETSEEDNLLSFGMRMGDISASSCNLTEDYVREILSIENGIISIGTFDGTKQCDSRTLIRSENYVVVQYDDGYAMARLR